MSEPQFFALCSLSFAVRSLCFDCLWPGVGRILSKGKTEIITIIAGMCAGWFVGNSLGWLS